MSYALYYGGNVFVNLELKIHKQEQCCLYCAVSCSTPYIKTEWRKKTTGVGGSERKQ